MEQYDIAVLIVENSIPNKNLYFQYLLLSNKIYNIQIIDSKNFLETLPTFLDLDLNFNVKNTTSYHYIEDNENTIYLSTVYGQNIYLYIIFI